MRGTKLIVLLLVVAAVAAGAAWALARRSVPATAGAEPAAGNEGQAVDALRAQRTKGDPNAPITVFEISDFQCPYCRGFWEETLPVLDREYIQTGKVKFTFLNLPLVQIHPNAAAAHEFAMCAASQDRFWPVHDLLYEHQDKWAGLEQPASFFMTLADSATLNAASLSQCLEAGAMRGLIQNEAQTIAQAGVTGTPTFVIEGGLMPNVPFEHWRPVLDSIYAARTDSGR